MKLSIILLFTATIICSSSAYPASGHPDDDAEVINNGEVEPGYQPTPSVPSVPLYPFDPSVPSIPTIPLYPSYPIYNTYTPSYFPFGWTYNVFGGFSNLFNHLRSTASNAWSKMPSVRPMINNYWPDVKTNGSTTSTVKVVGDHKFIINETVHVQQSNFGHIVFKVRTVNIKPANDNESNDETTEGVENDTTIGTNVDVDESNINRRPTEYDDDDDRVIVEDNENIDGNRIGSPEIFDDTNEITQQNNLEQFEHKEPSKLTEKIKMQSLMSEKSEKIEIDFPSEMISSEEIDSKTLSPLFIDQKKVNEEWDEIELNDSDEKKNTYYEVNNNENNIKNVEQVTIDLSDDIAINEMLADQGAPYNPDAEVFDISQYQPDEVASLQSYNKPQQESFDYLPYSHKISSNKRASIK